MINILGNTPGESSSKTTNDKYSPQSGEISSPCVDAIQSCSEGIKVGLDLKLNEFMSKNTALMPEDLTTQSMQALFKIFTLENKFYSLMGVVVMYALYRLLRDIVLSINFAAGVLTSHMYYNRQKYTYTPQSGTFAASALSSFAKVLIQTGQVIVGALKLFVTLSSFKSTNCIEYRPQASGFDFKDNSTKSPKTEPQPTEAKKTTTVKFGGKEPLPDPKQTLPEQSFGSCSFGPAVANANVKPRYRKDDDTFFGGFGAGI
jgi:hypothetical protein